MGADGPRVGILREGFEIPDVSEPDVDAAVREAAALGNLHNTSPFDVTGHPALSVPCGSSGGLPVGMMLA